MDLGSVLIGNGCWIGAKAVILKDVTLGDCCVVAAGAVVTRSFPEGSVVAGVPARLLKCGCERCGNTEMIAPASRLSLGVVIATRRAIPSHSVFSGLRSIDEQMVFPDHVIVVELIRPPILMLTRDMVERLRRHSLQYRCEYLHSTIAKRSPAKKSWLRTCWTLI